MPWLGRMGHPHSSTKPVQGFDQVIRTQNIRCIVEIQRDSFMLTCEPDERVFRDADAEVLSSVNEIASDAEDGILLPESHAVEYT